MYQSVIRDPGGQEWIRVYSCPCGPRSAVVDGSILIVPPGTVAFAEVNGILSDPYEPGRHKIMTGEDPFFVRLRHIMTHGDAGVTVTIFFISPGKDKFMRFGTGELPFTESRFRLTMKALASCAMTLSVENPKSLLEKMVGAYRASFMEEDLEPCIQQLILMPIRETLSRELSKEDLVSWNSRLSEISRAAVPRIQRELSAYGLKLVRFSLTGVHVPDSEMANLKELEKQYAQGKTGTDLELDHLRRIWGNQLNQRTLAEMLTGLSARGGEAQARGNGDMAAMMMQAMLLSGLMPNLQENLQQMMNPEREEEETGENPPPMPPRNR